MKKIFFSLFLIVMFGWFFHYTFADSVLHPAFYVWSSATLFGNSSLDATFLAKLKAYQANYIFLSLTSSQRTTYFSTSAGKTYLHNFINTLNDNGISVWLLLGDNSYLSGSWKQKLLAILPLFNAFNNEWDWFSQIHLDIEPYTLDGREWTPDATTEWLMQDYLDVLSAVQSATTSPVMADVYRRYKDINYEWVPFIEKILPYVDGIAVMHYITSSSLVLSRAQYFYNLTEAEGKDLFFALPFDTSRTAPYTFYKTSLGTFLTAVKPVVSAGIPCLLYTSPSPRD